MKVYETEQKNIQLHKSSADTAPLSKDGRRIVLS